MSKIVAFINQKGGVGKTTTAINVASKLKRDGREVVLVDLDPQGSAVTWIDQGEDSTDGPVVPAIQIGGNLHDAIKRLASTADWIIIDVPPRVEELSIAAIKACDLAIIPCQASPVDFWACKDVVDLIKQRNQIADGTPLSRFLITMAIKNTILGREIEDALKEYDMEVMKGKITFRQAYRQVAITGNTVLSLPGDNPAKTEIIELTDEIEALLNAN